MSEKNIIIVSEEDRNRVQRADIECASRMNLIAFMINNGMSTDTEQFARYQQEYQDAFVTFEAAKVEIEKKYLANLSVKNWNLNYATCELSYNV